MSAADAVAVGAEAGEAVMDIFSRRVCRVSYDAGAGREKPDAGP
jgi:hypothetical protein